jgi:DNA-binding response OmpR family regulator
MPARIVLVHDDTDFANRAAAAIRAAGYDIVAFEGSMAALEALTESAKTVKLLITRVNFGPGSPHGVSLAMMARRKIMDLKVLFLARPEQQEHAMDIGEFMPAPVTIPELVDRVSAMLAEAPSAPKQPVSQRPMTESR